VNGLHWGNGVAVLTALSEKFPFPFQFFMGPLGGSALSKEGFFSMLPGRSLFKFMSKKKEAKTNAMRLLDALHIPYRHYSYECREFVDARHTAEALNLEEEKMYKTLVTEGAPRQYYVFVIPIGAELSLKKAARTVGEKALSMLPVKDITAVTGYVRGGCTALGMKRKYPAVIDASAEALPEMVVSGGRLGSQIELNPVDLCRAAEGIFADVADIPVS
jgi:ybaK/ebsC protein